MASHCRTEHEGGDDHHHHGDDGHGHGHGHDHTHDDDVAPALQSSLHGKIDFDKVETLNERQPGSGAAVVRKTWQQRLDAQPEVVSDADEQLLMYIP
jgi:ABC-type Zn2+ transport system substrate-binding protein/surface adhesin